MEVGIAYQQGLLPHCPGSVSLLLRARNAEAQKTRYADRCDTGTLDVKLKAPNGTNVAVKGKQGFDGVTSGSVSSYP